MHDLLRSSLFGPPPQQHHLSAGDVCKGMIAGAIGGLIASWAMNQVHGIAGTMAKLAPEDGGDGAAQGSSSSQPEQSENEPQEPATVATATAVTRRVLHTELSDQQKQAAGPLVHYGYGTAMGALYGGLCEAAPAVGSGAGIPYGTVLWLIGDEVAVPMLGFSAPPTQMPLTTHADALAAHAIYGVATDVVRRVVRDAL